MAAAALIPTPRRVDPARIGPIVAAVVAVHVIVLSLPRQPPVASGTRVPAVQTVQVRMIEATDRQAPALAPAVKAANAVLPAPVEPLPAPSKVEPLPPSPEIQVQVESTPAVAVPAQNWLGLSLPGVANDDDRYFARSLLSVPPTPLQPVLIDYPAFADDKGRYVSELTLFIDETGTVVKVRVDGDALPPPLEDAARSAFLNARFRSGEIAEVGAVKSRIRIEVTFDRGDAPPAPR